MIDLEKSAVETERNRVIDALVHIVFAINLPSPFDHALRRPAEIPRADEGEGARHDRIRCRIAERDLDGDAPDFSIRIRINPAVLFRFQTRRGVAPLSPDDHVCIAGERCKACAIIKKAVVAGADG